MSPAASVSSPSSRRSAALERVGRPGGSACRGLVGCSGFRPTVLSGSSWIGIVMADSSRATLRRAAAGRNGASRLLAPSTSAAAAEQPEDEGEDDRQQDRGREREVEPEPLALDHDVARETSDAEPRLL